MIAIFYIFTLLVNEGCRNSLLGERTHVLFLVISVVQSVLICMSSLFLNQRIIKRRFSSKSLDSLPESVKESNFWSSNDPQATVNQS
jgi:hypothetical protein